MLDHFLYVSLVFISPKSIIYWPQFMKLIVYRIQHIVYNTSESLISNEREKPGQIDDRKWCPNNKQVYPHLLRMNAFTTNYTLCLDLPPKKVNRSITSDPLNVVTWPIWQAKDKWLCVKSMDIFSVSETLAFIIRL